jgi:Domain of unknown function (DUF4773)
MREICVIFLFVLISAAHAAKLDRNYLSVNDDEMNSIEREFLRNLTTILNSSEGRSKNSKKKIIKDMITKAPQIPDVTTDPVQQVSQRIPCECKTGVCSCCVGGFFFNNKGCMKMKYIPEDFAFEFRMMFNKHTLYKNTLSGKNPRPICISPPRFDNFVELCAKFHDIYFIGRNMHLCLDVTASLGEYDVLDR